MLEVRRGRDHLWLCRAGRRHRRQVLVRMYGFPRIGPDLGFGPVVVFGAEFQGTVEPSRVNTCVMTDTRETKDATREPDGRTASARGRINGRRCCGDRPIPAEPERFATLFIRDQFDPARRLPSEPPR